MILTCPSEQLRCFVDPVSQVHEDWGRGQNTQHHRGRVNLTIIVTIVITPDIFLLAHHVRLDSPGGVVEVEAAGVVAEVPGPQGSDPEAEHLALLTVYAVNPAGLLDGHIVPCPGHLHLTD